MILSAILKSVEICVYREVCSMDQIDSYILTIDGVAYNVQVKRPALSSVPHQASEAVSEPPAQAPWVTAQRIAHLPPR